jgi:nicotinamidase/pyrazinamidase
LAGFRRVVGWQDWHPPGHGSFAARYPGRVPGELITLGGSAQVLWPVHCVQDSFGAAFAEALDVGRIDAVVRKGMDPEIDSYSGFFDNDRVRATGLADRLRELGESELWVLGLALDYCVKATALDAVRLGFRVHLIVDGCRAVELEAGDGARAIAEATIARDGYKAAGDAERLARAEKWLAEHPR